MKVKTAFNISHIFFVFEIGFHSCKQEQTLKNQKKALIYNNYIEPDYSIIADRPAILLFRVFALLIIILLLHRICIIFHSSREVKFGIRFLDIASFISLVTTQKKTSMNHLVFVLRESEILQNTRKRNKKMSSFYRSSTEMHFSE